MSAAEIAGFLDWWFERSPGRLVASTKPNVGSFDQHRPFGDRSEAAQWMFGRAPERNVYVRMTTVEDLNGVRGPATDTTMLPGFYLDVDLEGPNHKTPGRLPTLVDAEAMLGALPSPSAVVHSGGGLYALWRFSEPLATDTTERWDTVAGLARRFQDAVTQLWAGWGLQTGEPFHIDRIGQDLARILRPVGSFNHKTGEPVPVRWHRPPAGNDYDPVMLLDTVEAVASEWAPPPSEPIVVGEAPKRILRSGPGEGPSAVFNSTVSLQDVLDTDTRFGPWSFLGEQRERIKGSVVRTERWLRSGSTSPHSLKRFPSGVVVVWSATVAAHLGIEPGIEGVDLFGLFCRLHDLDPSSIASEIGRNAARRAREAVR